MTVGGKSRKETEKNYKKWERPRKETGKNQENEDFKADFDGDERFKMSPNSFNCWDISLRQSAAKTL